MIGGKRVVARAAEDGKPAIYRFAVVLAFHDGEDLVVTANPLLANLVRSGSPKSLAMDKRYIAARERVGNKALFGYADLQQFKAQVANVKLPKQLGEALILGAFSHAIKSAPWVAFGADVVADAEHNLKLTGEAVLPAPEGTGAVDKSFRGTLAPLPFAMPERSIGVIRLRRDLASIWTNREQLIPEARHPRPHPVRDQLSATWPAA